MTADGAGDLAVTRQADEAITLIRQGAQSVDDRSEARLCGAVMVGTHSATEMIEDVRAGLPLDATLVTLSQSYSMSHNDME